MIRELGTPQPFVTGLVFAEGPVWSAAENALYFVDLSGDAIYRMAWPSTLETLVQPSGHASGLGIDPQGRLVVAGFAWRAVWRLAEGQIEVLADQYDGHKLNSPDDLTISTTGDIYFTDPTFGIDGTTGLPTQAEELGFDGVFRITRDGTLQAVDTSIAAPNGIALSPDEHTLYVSSTATSTVYAFTVQADGSLTDKRVLAKSLLGADSMCIDAQGNLYIATLFGISVVTPTGKLLGSISVPLLTSNVAFGGPDRRTLFITARNALSFISTENTGVVYHLDNMPIPGPARGK